MRWYGMEISDAGHAFIESRSPTARRSSKFAQDDKWNFCLTVAIIASHGRHRENTTAPQLITAFHGEGGACCHPG
jgi:hypothetical protein